MSVINKIFKIAILFVSVAFIAISCSKVTKPTDSFTIKGEVKGLNGNLFFYHPDRPITSENIVDTIKVVDGKLSYSGSVSELSLISAFPDFKSKDKDLFKVPKGGRGMFPVKSVNLMFFAFPGANIEISGEATEFMNAYPSGDKFNESLAAINKIAYPNFNKVGDIAVQNSYETDSVKIRANKKKSELIVKENIDQLISHIKDNPKSIGAVSYLSDMLLRKQIDDTTAEELFNGISKEFAEYSDYKNIAARIEGIKTTKEGMPVPLIKTTATLDGSEFDINALKGKYVLIDFWGTWCGPCVAEMPEVKQFQEKHMDNLVVLGINSGDTKERIQAFVDKHDYRWMQLLSDKKNTSDNFVNRFNVQGFPTKLIIDRRGNIVNRFVGGGEEAFEVLEELLSK